MVQFPNYLETITDWRSLTLHLQAKLCARCPFRTKGDYKQCESCAEAVKIKELTTKDLRLKNIPP